MCVLREECQDKVSGFMWLVVMIKWNSPGKRRLLGDMVNKVKLGKSIIGD